MTLPPLVSDATLQRDLDVLGSAIHWGKDYLKLRIVEHPMPGTKKYLVVQNESSRRPAAHELDKLFVATESAVLKPIVEFAIVSSLRRSEICALHIEDIDWVASVVRIRQEKADRLKKSRQKGREVPLSSTARSILEQQVDDRCVGVVFDIQSDALTQAFRRACQRAGIKNWVFHDLRHHALSNWAERGMTPHELQMIGHRDMRSLACYIHGKAEAVAKRMQSLG